MVSRGIDTVSSMAGKWFMRQHGLEYVELYSGPGRLLNERTGKEQPGSPMQALAVRKPFTRYVFSDYSEECIEALAARVGDRPDVHVLQGDQRAMEAGVRQAPDDSLHYGLRYGASRACDGCRRVAGGRGGGMTRVEEVIRRAIRERRPVALEYRRSGQGLRTVHPHVLYRTSTGAVCVDAYQVEGYTSAGRSLPGWRAFDLDQVVSAEPLDGRFALAPGFNPAARKYSGEIVASA